MVGACRVRLAGRVWGGGTALPRRLVDIKEVEAKAEAFANEGLRRNTEGNGRVVAAEQRATLSEQRATLSEQHTAQAEQRATLSEQRTTLAEQREGLHNGGVQLMNLHRMRTDGAYEASLRDS